MSRNLLIATVLLWASSVMATDVAGTLKVDPVELVRGNEVEGNDDISATHYRYRYLFANEQNRDEFEKHPEKYEIQLGGACGRMGALSGLGRTDLYAAHAGKIYIFASEACKQTFLRDPTRVLERPDPKLVSSPAARQKGLALLEKAVEAMGGAERIDSIEVFKESKQKKSEWEGKVYDVTDTVTIEFPDRIRTDHVLGKDRYTTVVTEHDGWKQTPDETFSLHPQQREAAERLYLGRNLLAILKARGRPGFAAAHAGQHDIDYNGKPTTVELVHVHYRGAANYLGIDPSTGRVLSQSFAGRGPDLLLGLVEHVFTDFETVDGVLLPKEPAVKFNGKKVDGNSDKKVTMSVDPSLDATFFQRPGS